MPADTGVNNGINTSSSITALIPANIRVGDCMLMMLEVFCETSTVPSIAFSGGGGGWTLVPMTSGSNPATATTGSGSPQLYSYTWAYYRFATLADQNATITITETGSPSTTTWFAIAIEGYTFVNPSNPIDVAASLSNTGVASIQCPTLHTTNPNDWSVQMVGAGLPSSGSGALTGPGTQRQQQVSTASIAAAIYDSNAFAGAANAVVGGGTFNATAAVGTWWNVFTVVLNIQPGVIVPIGQAGVAGGNFNSPEPIGYTSVKGNSLIITGHLYNNNDGHTITPVGVSDSAGNVWHISTTNAQTPPTETVADTSDGASASFVEFIAWCLDALAITQVVITNNDTNAVWTRVAITEWAGIVQFDNSNVAASSAAGTTMSLPVQLNAQNELVIACFDWGGTDSVTLPSSWAYIAASGSLDQAYYFSGATTGPYTPVFTNSVAESYAGAIAVFSPISLTGSGLLLAAAMP